MQTPPDVRTQINEVRRADTFGSSEFYSRFALVAAGCAAGWLWLGLEVMPYWFAGYYGAVLVEKIILRQYPAAESGRFLVLLVLVSIVISGIYVALPIYLWFRPEPVWQFAAMVMLVAGCLNIHQLRARVWPVALAYFLPMGVAFVVIASGFWTGSYGDAEFRTAMVLAFLISGYLALTVFEAQKANARRLHLRAQLLQTQKVAALESLVAGIAHEFRHLLSIIQGNLELLQDRPAGVDRRACIHDALAAARSGTRLGTQLDCYARGASTIPCKVDPIAVINEVRLMARHVLPATVRLQSQTPSSMDHLHVDQSALQAVLLNLIVHARDMLEGSGTISLETYMTEASRAGPGSASVVFEVCDSGAGADMAEADRTKGADAGPRSSGLALASARGFADQWGGALRIECGPGHGRRIQVHLPV